MSLFLSPQIRSRACLVGALILQTLGSSGCLTGRSRGTASVRTQRPQTEGEVRVVDASQSKESSDQARAADSTATVSYSSHTESASGFDNWLKQLPSVPRIPLPRTDAEPAGIDRL